MSIAPLVFQGISKFSTDFQTIVDRRKFPLASGQCVSVSSKPGRKFFR
jgi:hypothetical protein